ncbi:hypothetical protein CBE37_01220 [bacterium TMED277]|nr:MAG: hypothetical protein CBE37_01220 [bacterium TMED277]|tara:strand:- start:1624 stop:2547 length:924 start_codon:yes stop_codon:yes gene_type:complete
MELFKKIYLKILDKNKYQLLKTKKKIEENKDIYKNIIEKKIYDIQEKINNKKSLNFLHSGHCGDIICSLPVIQELAKSHQCNLFIKINKKMPLPYYKHPAGDVFIDQRIYNLIEPLLKKQKYINNLAVYNEQEIDIDLDLFREMPINISFNAPRWFFHITGVQVDLTQPYLEATEHKDMKNKIILHRTFRYRNNFINFKFLNDFNDIFFIGLENEYLDLKKEIKNLNFYECKDYLDMANIIKSSKFFIGNSSIAFPMAEALKVPRLLEACPEFPIIQPSGKDAFDFYYQPHFEKLFHYLNKKYTNTK